MERRRQSIDLALQLGHTAIGLLLALARRRRGDTWTIGFRASFAWLVGTFLVATDLESSTRVAGARSLQVVRGLGRAGRAVSAAMVMLASLRTACRVQPQVVRNAPVELALVVVVFIVRLVHDRTGR